jgi:nucleotide-binding universal stress UspA family protein
MSTIIVGLTDDSHGREALDAGIEEARLRHAKLVVVHSMEGGSKTDDREMARYQRVLKNVRSRLAETGLDFDVSQYVRGNTPSEDLAEAVRDYDAELVVIGYRRRTATGKALLGSDAQAILMRSPVPVLAVSSIEPD